MKYKVNTNIEKLKTLKDLGIIKTEKVINQQLTCLCPFHEEKNASFGINLKNGYYNCFSCGESGKSFDTFFHKIAEKYGIIFEQNTSAVEKLNRELQLLKIPEKEQVLINLPTINESIFQQYPDMLDSYMKERITKKEIRDLFEIKYSKKHNKYLIPIRDENKRLVGYVTRQFIEPKYKYNSFKKSHILFGLDKVKSSQGIVTEGTLDVIKTFDNGHPCCVALLGSDMSEVQEKKILKYFDSLILATDNDKAGKRAMEDMIQKLKNKITLYRIKWITGKKDLGELTREELESEIKNKVKIY